MKKEQRKSEPKFWRLSVRLQASEYTALSDMVEESDIPLSVFVRALIRLGLQVFSGTETDDLPTGLTRGDVSELVMLGVSETPFQGL